MLAAAPITWGVCELPNWGVVPPASQVLDEIAAAGFQGTELGQVGYFPAEPGDLRRALHARALQLVGAFFPIPLNAEDAGRSALEEGRSLARLLSSVGCTTLVAAEAGDDSRLAIAGRVPEAGRLPAGQWKRAGQILAELARITEEVGVSVVFHPHAGTYVETEAELDALLEATPDQVGLCLDTGHVAYGGGDPAAVARRYAGRVRHVHVKDVSEPLLQRVRQEGLGYADAVGQGIFTPLGEGSIDFPAVIAALRDQHYHGWYVLEQDVRLGPPWPTQNPAQNAAASRQYLEKLLAAPA